MRHLIKPYFFSKNSWHNLVYFPFCQKFSQCSRHRRCNGFYFPVRCGLNEVSCSAEMWYIMKVGLFLPDLPLGFGFTRNKRIGHFINFLLPKVVSAKNRNLSPDFKIFQWREKYWFAFTQPLNDQRLNRWIYKPGCSHNFLSEFLGISKV